MNTKELEKCDLLLLDGNNLLNRAYFGLAGRSILTSPKGEPTAALFAFLNMFFAYQDKFKPSRSIVCFDHPEKGFRSQLYVDYKAGRKPMPSDLAQQFPWLKKILSNLGVLCLEQAGDEADDLIGTLAKRASKRQQIVVIVSGDRDLWQLLEPQIFIVFPSGKSAGGRIELIDEKQFQAEYGLEVEQFVDLKALMGDSSDNIPGVPGIGVKGGIELLQKYGSLDGIYANLAEIRATLQKKLILGREQAFLSRQLAQINLACSLPDTIDEQLTIADYSALQENLHYLAIHNFDQRLGLSLAPGAQQVEVKEQKPRLELRPTPLDAEVFWQENNATELALSYGEDGTCLFANERGDWVQLNELALRSFWAAISERSASIITYAAKSFLHKFELTAPKTDFTDLALLNYLLNTAADESESSSSDPLSMFALAAEKLKLLRERSLTELYLQAERPLLSLLYNMEQTGIALDRSKLAEVSVEFHRELNSLEAEIFALAGYSFNLNSSKQLGELLFQHLQLRGGKKNKNGEYSTAAAELERLWTEHEIIPLLAKYREKYKLCSTFVDGLDKVIGADGRIHSSFNQLVTSTGRLSSSRPNLQNIPVRTAEGNNIRKLFVAAAGKTLLDADYSQIELRVLAHLSGDKKLKTLFAQGIDIHSQTAASIFAKDISAVSPAERRIAKTVNFSVIYGISEFSLAKDLGVTIYEAKSYIENWFALFPQVGQWMRAQLDFAQEKLYVCTMFGRRRYLPELRSKNYNLRQFAQRAAMNAPVQGTAADIMKIAMVQTQKALQAAKLQSQIILQVHDELLIEAPLEELPLAATILKNSMEQSCQISVPLAVNVEVGSNWGELLPWLA